MEREAMRLDRLPWKREVVSQLLFFVDYDKNVDRIGLSHQFVSMVAEAVAYVWTEAGIPCRSRKEIRTLINGLLDSVVDAFDRNSIEDDRSLERKSKRSFRKPSQVLSILESLNPREVLTLNALNELFDVADVEAVQFDRKFYEDQKLKRKMTIAHLAGRRCYQGDDIYFTPTNQWAFKSRLFQRLGCHEPFFLPEDRLPTKLDLLKFFYSRMYWRKNSHSTGQGETRTNVALRHDATSAALSAWKKRQLPTISLKLGRERLQRLLDWDRNKRKNGEMSEIHRRGLSLDTRRYRWENQAYESLYLDAFEREVFNLFPNSSSVPECLPKRVAPPPKGEIKNSDVASLKIKASRLRTVDLEEFISKARRVEEEEWRREDVETGGELVVRFDEPLLREVGEEEEDQDSSVADDENCKTMDSSTQTMPVDVDQSKMSVDVMTQTLSIASSVAATQTQAFDSVKIERPDCFVDFHGSL